MNCKYLQDLDLINIQVNDVKKESHNVKVKKRHPKHLDLETSEGREKHACRKLSGDLQTHSSNISYKRKPDLPISSPDEFMISRPTMNTKSLVNSSKHPNKNLHVARDDYAYMHVQNKADSSKHCNKNLHVARDEYAYVHVRNKADRTVIHENSKTTEKASKCSSKNSSRAKVGNLKFNNEDNFEVSCELLNRNCQTVKSSKSLITRGTQTIGNFCKEPNLPKKPSKDMKKTSREGLLQQLSQSKNSIGGGLLNQTDQAIGLEKSIQLAVSLEFDKIRCHLNDQCISMHKELEKIMMASQKGHEVNQYLFSVIEDLMRVNRQLVKVISSNN